MELGIDVGDLDRVAQIDAPWTVAGFLQRLGRTGRRAGTPSNCLFLTTSDRALRDTMGLLRAWADGWVEPVEPPPFPAHVLVQQLLALLRQEGILGENTWREWLGAEFALGDEVEEHIDGLIAHLLVTGYLHRDGGMLQLGPEAERRYGNRNYLDLTAVFADPPTLAVVQGRTVLGQVHVKSLLQRRDDGDSTILLIAGRDWAVDHVDWKRRVVHVQPATGNRGKPRWIGAGPGTSSALARAIRRFLAGEDVPGVTLSKRAKPAVDDLRDQFRWLEPGVQTDVVEGADGQTWWWTFAGDDANVELSAALGELAPTVSSSGLAIRIEDGLNPAVIEAALAASGGLPAPDVPEDLADAWKFSDALPNQLVRRLLAARMRDSDAVEASRNAPVRGHALMAPGPRP